MNAPMIVLGISIVFIIYSFLIAYAGIGKARPSNREQYFAEHGPTILTSIGILATFIGIALGLWDFDTKRINESIPVLLGGLKLAFTSSVAGLLFALLFRWLKSSGKTTSDVDEVSGTDILKELKEGTLATKNVREALIGDGEASLATQIGKLRNEMQDLRRDFREFAEKVVADGSQALIEALEKVIADFNTKINEQFGENFKQLNQAVGGLLQWQMNYKDQVETLTKVFEECKNSIISVEKSISEIEKKTKPIPEYMEVLNTLLQEQRKQLDETEKSLESLANLRSNASEAIPLIEENLNKLTKTMRNFIDEETVRISESSKNIQSVVEGVSSSLQKTVEGFSETSKSHAEEMNDTVKNVGVQIRESLKTELESLSGSVSDISGKINADMKAMVDDVSKGLKESVDKQFVHISDSVLPGVEKKISSTIETIGTNIKTQLDSLESNNHKFSKLGEDVGKEVIKITESMNKISGDFKKQANESFQIFDAQMQSEVNRCLDKMGNNLVSISDRFVKVYEESSSRISDEMRKISRNN